MVRSILVALTFALIVVAPGPAPGQATALATVTLTFPSEGGAQISQSQNGVSHSYEARLAPSLDGGRVVAVNVVLHESPAGANLLAITGEAAPRSRFYPADCLGDPPSGGLSGREREFDLPGQDAHAILTLEACSATETEIRTLTARLSVERGARPRPP